MSRYLYQCGHCRRVGALDKPDDSYEGTKAKCESCGAEVVLEWDDGVKPLKAKENLSKSLQ